MWSRTSGLITGPSLFTLNMIEIIFALTLCASCFGFEADLTVDIGAGKMECFFQPISKANGVELEYQVIDGGDLDINFFAHGPDGRVLVSEHRQTDNVHKFDLQSTGDLKVCFDNTFSHFQSKLVFFEMVSDEDDEQEESPDNWAGAKEELQQVMDMTLDEFKATMDRITQNLDKSKNLQTVLKMYEARDRNVVEANFDRVNFFSLVQLLIMVTVGLVQVLLIRNLFEDKRKVKGIMKSQT